jgi:hypothetical protein
MLIASLAPGGEGFQEDERSPASRRCLPGLSRWAQSVGSRRCEKAYRLAEAQEVKSRNNGDLGQDRRVGQIEVLPIGWNLSSAQVRSILAGWPLALSLAPCWMSAMSSYYFHLKR